MTPARATTMFWHRRPGALGKHDTREALQWWGIAALAGWLAVWRLAPRITNWVSA
jgi:hypothetical protein